MAPSDMPEFGGINQLADGLTQGGEHGLVSRVKEQGFFVADKEMVELHIQLRDVDRNSKEVGSDFVDGGHGGDLIASSSGGNPL